MSNDEGDSWTKKNNGVNCPNINCFAVSGTNIFAGTTGGILFSGDNCETWYPANNGIKGFQFKTLVSAGDNLFASSKKSIYVSTDNGLNWKAAYNKRLDNSIYCLAASDWGIAAGIDLEGVLISTDGGNSWEQRNNGIEYETVKGVAIQGHDIVSGLEGKGIFVSTDKGSTWLESNEGISDFSISSVIATAKHLFAGTYNHKLYIRAIGENNWNIKNLNSIMLNMAVKGDKFYAATMNGVFVSTDSGDSWMQKNEGLSNFLYVPGILSLGNNIIIASDWGIHYSTNDGESWTDISAGLVNTDISSMAVSGGFIVVSTIGNGIFRAKLSDFGITEVKEKNLVEERDLLIYPNPAGDYLSIGVGTGRDLSLPGEAIHIYNTL